MRTHPGGGRRDGTGATAADAACHQDRARPRRRFRAVVVFYYANYDGPFGLMGLKVMCISGATYECAAFQRMIHSAIPVYYPVLWYAGLVALIVGIYQNWKAK
jgi:hypothetical protein